MEHGEILERLTQRALAFHRALVEAGVYHTPISETEFLRRTAEGLQRDADSIVQRDANLDLELLALPQGLLFDLSDAVFTTTWDSEEGGKDFFECLERLFRGSPFTFRWTYSAELGKLSLAIDSLTWSVACPDLYGEDLFINPITFSKVDPILFGYVRDHGWTVYDVVTGDQCGRYLLVPLAAVGGLREYLITPDDPRAEWLYYGLPEG